MPALNFKPQFATLVKRWKKRQTIRAYRKDGRDPKPGQSLFLYTGMRTKQCKLLGMAVCRSVEKIGMSGGDIAVDSVDIDGRLLAHHEKEWLAKDDGFQSWEQMRHWFHKTHGVPFHGLLIKWS